MTIKTPVLLIVLGCAGLIGLLAGLSIDGEEQVSIPGVVAEGKTPAAAMTPAAVAATDDGARTRIDALERRLQQEIEERVAMQQRLEELDRQLAALDRGAVPEALEAQESSGSGEAGNEPGWFDENALLESGMAESQARELKMFFEQLELERLQLRDRSVREDWERARLGDELRLLDERERELRESLGEPAYDAYLYASGQPNRVAVTSVLASAQAAQAGIEPGDLIIRYDRERIYSWRDLRSATTSGSLSDTIEVEVERDGDTLRFYLARGPLGIRMDSRSVAP